MRLILCVAAAALTVASGAAAATTTVTVAGQANLNLAGQPAGTPCCSGDAAPGQSPVLAPMSFQAGDVFSFAVTGVTDGAGTGPTGPDGAYIFDMADYGLAAAPAYGVGVLGTVGLFLGSSLPAGHPVGLNFHTIGLNFAALAPALGQMFWIGDGLTGTGSGASQAFTAPTGATRLFLGTVDGFQWSNNTGAYTVTITSSGAGVPEPASWALMIAGFGLAGATMRRRRRALAA